MAGPDNISNDQILALLFVIAPQFKTDDPVILAGYITLIDALRCMINVNVLGCCAALAFANLLAHYLTLQQNPLIGVSSSLSEGQLSIGLATTVNGNFFGSTAYGQAYLQLIGKYRIGVYVTNSRRFNHGPPCCGGY